MKTGEGDFSADFRNKLLQRLKSVRRSTKRSLERLSSTPVPNKRPKKGVAFNNGPRQELSVEANIPVDDADTHDLNVARLRKEKDLKSKLASSIMSSTFEIRRIRILQGAPFSELLVAYPPLKDCFQLLSEFHRVVKDEAMSQRIQDNWASCVSKILAYATREQNAYIKGELAMLSKIKNHSSYQSSKAALRILPRLLFGSKRSKEPENYVFQSFHDGDLLEAATSIPARNSPFLLEENGKVVYLVIEQAPLLQLDDTNLGTAIAARMAAYFVFNMSYPTEAKGTFFLFSIF